MGPSLLKSLRVTREFLDASPSLCREDVADDLREQAASCRRLAKRATTASGLTALRAVAAQFDLDALRIDPGSLRR